MDDTESPEESLDPNAAEFDAVSEHDEGSAEAPAYDPDTTDIEGSETQKQASSGLDGETQLKGETGEDEVTQASHLGGKTHSNGPEQDDDLPKAHTGWGANDQKTTEDQLDFETYVSVLREFLTYDRTTPPLTVSIEGQWGTGKSSFMAMLKADLEALNEATEDRREGDGAADEHPRYFTVEFNPWRHEHADGLWAAFMLEFFDQITADLGITERLVGHLRLLRHRLQWRRSWRNLLSLSVVILLVGLVLLLPQVAGAAGVPLSGPELLVGQGVSVLAVVGWAWRDVANPVQTALKQYLNDPNYEQRVSFIEQFHEDFARILDAYVGDEAEVFVFIDDLDRCLPRKSAELIQSINLMISGGHRLNTSKGSRGPDGHPRVFFLIGMDREKVAAGIAAKHDDLLEYLRASDRRTTTPSSSVGPDDDGSPGIEDSIEQFGLDFADNYLEKFVQIPFFIPRPREEGIGNLIRDMASTDRDDGSANVDGALAVVELLLTAHHYGDGPPAVTDDLPPRIQDVYPTAGDLVPPLEVTMDAARGVAGDEEWYDVLDDLPFTDHNEAGEPLQITNLESATNWYRERATQAQIETNPTLAAAFDQSDQGRDGDRPAKESEVLPTDRLVLIGKSVAPALDYNPRNVKTFVNLFRLRAMLASELGLFDGDTLTPEQLGKFVAISLRWPEVSTRLGDPAVAKALNEFAFGETETPPTAIDTLSASERAKLSDLLTWGVDDPDQGEADRHRLESVPEELFWISPRIDKPAHQPDGDPSVVGAEATPAS